MKTIWFRRKRYGWGWYPVTWQGWLLVLIYILFAAATPFLISLDANPDRVWWFFGALAAATVILLAICWKKGEPPRWQWGEED